MLRGDGCAVTMCSASVARGSACTQNFGSARQNLEAIGKLAFRPRARAKLYLRSEIWIAYSIQYPFHRGFVEIFQRPHKQEHFRRLDF